MSDVFYDSQGMPYTIDAGGNPIPVQGGGSWGTPQGTTPVVQGTMPLPASQTVGYGGVTYDPNDTENAWQAWTLQNALNNQAANNGLISGLNSASAGVGAQTQNVRQGQTGIIQSQMNSDAGFAKQTQDLVNQLSGAARGANRFAGSALGNYQRGLSTNTVPNTHSLSNLSGLTGQPATRLRPQT